MNIKRNDLSVLPISGPVDTKFIEEAIQELLKARRTLKFSYPYGYYLEDRGGSKQIFEFMQVCLFASNL